MILNISNLEFEKLFSNEKFTLPIRWDGSDFSTTLKNNFDYYISSLNHLQSTNGYIYVDINEIKSVCNLLTRAVNYYLNGLPSKAYSSFTSAMKKFMRHPLQMYHKNILEQFKSASNSCHNDDSLKLFRITSVGDNKPYGRERVFHTPYNLRSKVSTNRYSIAGYPSLYLGTSLDLCGEEIHLDPHQDFALASIFKLNREVQGIDIQVIELGIKPSDFLDNKHDTETSTRKIERSLLHSTNVRTAYLLWYPLISACSYIRVNKNDPFAAEYIIPQLLMQWARNEITPKRKKEQNLEFEYENAPQKLIGIRYFSCASQRASDMGFNYVFPTSGQQLSPEQPYCSVLTQAFYLTTPVYVHEYTNLSNCKNHLLHKKDFGQIENKT